MSNDILNAVKACSSKYYNESTDNDKIDVLEEYAIDSSKIDCSTLEKKNDSNKNELERILDKLNYDIDKINERKNKIYIVNAGRMNHGKSSLFNSVLNKSEFAVGDIRTTIKCSEAQLKDNVYLVDTPGLDAVNSDDQVAFEAYKKANMIVFVHTPNVGEFHKDEIEKINQIIDLFPSRRFFWEHFCLVFTFTEAIDEKELKSIQTKILKDIKENCGGIGFPVFYVSNKRYIKGIKENKKTFVSKSGVEILRNYLLDRSKILSTENTQLQNNRINARIALAEKEIELLKEQTIKRIEYNETHWKKEKRKLLLFIDKICREILEFKNIEKEKKQQINDLKDQIEVLISRHNDEVY